MEGGQEPHQEEGVREEEGSQYLTGQKGGSEEI